MTLEMLRQIMGRVVKRWEGGGGFVRGGSGYTALVIYAAPLLLLPMTPTELKAY